MCLKTYMSRLPLGEAGPKGLKGQGWNPGGHRPPFDQPSLDREGACGAGGWDDLCLFSHVTLSLSAKIINLSSLSRVDFSTMKLYRRYSREWFRLDRCPPLRGAPLSKGAALFPIESFFLHMFRH